MISVALAAYQGARYLAVQLDSILLQLGETDELVVSYDESTDHTFQVLKQYQKTDHRVKIVRNSVRGVTANFNNAISHCSGDYIYISDQDDKWSENKIQTVQQCFAESGADLVIHNGIHTDEELDPVGVPFFEMYQVQNGIVQDFLKPRMSGCCMAFKQKMKDIILPIPEIRGYDQWIAIVCELWGKVAYSEEVLIYHRLHGDNVTTGARRPLGVVLRMRMRLIANLLLRAWRLTVGEKR